LYQNRVLYGILPVEMSNVRVRRSCRDIIYLRADAQRTPLRFSSPPDSVPYSRKPENTSRSKSRNIKRQHLKIIYYFDGCLAMIKLS